jgi:hypothetical protein
MILSPRMRVKEKSIDAGELSKKNFLVLAGVLFAVALTWFLFVANNVLFFQSEQFLFIFSVDHLKEFLLKPGGLLEYSGRFISQFYVLPLVGSLLLSVILVCTGFITLRILRVLNSASFLAAPTAIITSVLLLLMQTRYYHTMEYNLGYLFILISFYYSIKYKESYFPVLLFPLIYYISGAFAFVYLLMYAVYSLVFISGIHKILRPAMMTLAGAFTFFLFKEYFFLVPGKALISWPLPVIEDGYHKTFFICLTAFLIFLPLISRLRLPRRSYEKTIRFSGLISGGLIIIAGIIMMIRISDPTISSVLNIQEAAYKGEWDEVIKVHEKEPSGNLVGDYFYNVALSERGLLCDRLFSGRQVFGTRALILPWGNEHLSRGAWFFFTAGLINEAHRWAYEEMVVYGKRPHNMLMLIKTSLLAGNNSMAEKYTGILKKTLFYRDEAIELSKLIGNDEGIQSNRELGTLALMIPQKEFFIYVDNPADNLLTLFESNPANKRAFEYMMAWLLLEKDIETVLSNIHLMKGLGYTRLPRHIEEAVMIYYNSQGNFPDLSGFAVSPETMTRFSQYFTTFVQARKNPETLDQIMSTRFGDTFWYYFHFHK